MSSVLSGFRGRSDLPIPNGAVVLTYSTEGPDQQPVPWTYNNGTLDLDFSGDFTSNTSIDDGDAFLRYSSGALHLVNSIGPNLIAWMEDRGNADAGSVTVHEYPIVIRANVIQPDSTGNESCTQTNNDPYNFTQSAGGPNNNWFTTYLFQKAMVLKYTTNGGSTTEYRYFLTQIGERNT